MQGRCTRDIMEFIAALLMALATIASAWCGYQSTRWNGKQSILAGETAALRFEATRKLTLAGQEAVIDISTFEQLHRALVEDRTEYAQSILKRLRPEARIAVAHGLPQSRSKIPPLPLVRFVCRNIVPAWLRKQTRWIKKRTGNLVKPVRQISMSIVTQCLQSCLRPFSSLPGWQLTSLRPPCRAAFCSSASFCFWAP